MSRSVCSPQVALFIFCLLLVLRPIPASASDPPVTPYLVSLQSSEFRRAWLDLEKLVAENAARDEPLADPLIARAELWARMGCYEDAVHDYNSAAQILLTRQAGLVERSRVLEMLRQSLQDLDSQPKVVYPQHADAAYRRGVALFSSGELDSAVPYLEDACRLRPNDAVYRIVRAITYRRLGRHDESTVQMKSAASILRHPYADEDLQWRMRIENIQGPDRAWAEEFLASMRVTQP